MIRRVCLRSGVDLADFLMNLYDLAWILVIPVVILVIRCGFYSSCNDFYNLVWSFVILVILVVGHGFFVILPLIFVIWY